MDDLAVENLADFLEERHQLILAQLRGQSVDKDRAAVNIIAGHEGFVRILGTELGFASGIKRGDDSILFMGPECLK